MKFNELKSFFYLLPFLILFQTLPTQSAKIVGIFPIKSRSHHSINGHICKTLASIGHQVTIMSHFKSNHPINNLTEILIDEELPSFVDTMEINKSYGFRGLIHYMKFLDVVENQPCAKILASEYIQKLIRSDEKIDLLFAGLYHSKCYLLLAHKLNVPLIVVSISPVLIGVDYFIGNPNNPSYLPFIWGSSTSKMNLFERLINSFQYATLFWWQNFVFNENAKQLAEKYLEMDIPSDDVLSKTIALSFYNNHYTFIPRIKSPNVIDIAGIHIQEAKKLPEDIEEFIEQSPDGVILFTFGSTIRASSMSSETLQIIAKVFSTIPQRILWRVDQLNITEVPSNVKLIQWLPQRDILEHKNVIAFISHCGLLGIFEAIQTATPIIGIPFAFDQFQNARILAEQGIGIQVDYESMNERTFSDAIHEITLNQTYQQNVQKLSAVFRHRPASQMDEVIYWTEHVLKFKGAPHLRPRAGDMPLYQYLLLDVLAFVICITICVLYSCKYLLKKVYFLFSQRKDEKKTQ